MYKKIFFAVFSVLLLPFFVSCIMGGNDFQTDRPDTGFVNFYNASSYKVELYKGVNPTPSDTSTIPIAVISSGKTAKLNLPPSVDQEIGDVFYIRYLIEIDNGLTSGGTPIYAKAKPDISNLTFVISADKTYNKNIEQPMSGKLKFVSGYIKVQNTSSDTFQVIHGSTVLENLASKEINLLSGKTGIYKIDFSFLDEEKKKISGLKFKVTSSVTDNPVPQFEIEQGEMVTFEFNGSEIKGPVSKPLLH